MAVKMVFDGDSAKLRAELDKITKANQSVTAEFEKQVKISEKAQAAVLREVELRKRETQAKKESIEEARKLTAENAKQAKEIDRLNDKSAKQKAAQNEMLATGAKAAAGMIASYVSLNTIIGTVTAAHERMRAVSEKSMTESERVARSQSQLIFNMPGATKQEVAGVDARVRAAAARAGVGLPEFYETVASTSAATGGNYNAAILAAEAAAPLSRLDQQNMSTLSAAGASIARSTGLDSQASLGMLMQYGGVGRQETTEQIALAIPEAIAAGALTSSDKAMGAEWAMERMAALTVETDDVQGRRSATAIANLAVKMEKFFEARPELGVATNPYAREEFLTQNPELAKEFMAGLGGEITSYAPIRDLFREGSAMRARVEGNQAAIDQATALGMYERTVAAAEGGTPELVEANRAERSRARTGAAMLRPGKSTRAQVDDEVRRALEAGDDGSYLSGWGAYLAETEYEWAAAFDPLAAGEATLGPRRGSLVPGQGKAGPLDPEALKVLEEIRDQLKRQNDEPSHAVDTGVRQ